MLRNLVGTGTWDGLRNAEGELVAMRMSEFLGGAPPGADGHTRWPEAHSPLAASGRVRLGGGGRDRRDPQGRRGGAVPPAFREHADGHRMGAASWRRTTSSWAWPPGGFPAAWPTTTTPTTSCTPFARVMVGHSAGSSRAGAAQSQDRARLLSDRSHREMGSRRATSIQSCKIGGIELPP